jgi:hypothetical protein
LSLSPGRVVSPRASLLASLASRLSRHVSLLRHTIIIAHRPPPSCRRSCVLSRCVLSCLVVSCLVVAPPNPSRRFGLSHCVVVDCRVVIVAHRHTVGCCVRRCHRVKSCPCPLARCFWHLSRRVCRVVIAHRLPQTQPPSSSLRRRRGGNGNVSRCHCGKSQRVINCSHVDDATNDATSLSSESSVTGPPTPPTTPPIAPPYPPEPAVHSASLTRSSKRHPRRPAACHGLLSISL